MDNNKIKCAIVDDEPLALDLMESYVRRQTCFIWTSRCPN